MIWQTSRFNIDLSRPQVMGIVNVTPDSFSDGGRHAGAGSALAHCEQLIRDGADILDIGGESSRPGAPPLPLEEELARVVPVVREAVKLGAPVSVDTYKPGLMQAVLDLGADIINDIWALRQPGALQVIAGHAACGVCLMHMHREPQTMQAKPMEGDVLPQVLEFLARRTSALLAEGVNRNRIVWDAGTGFGKTVAQNFALLARQAELLQAGYPVLAGWSRKSSLGAVTGLEVQDRLAPSIAAALLAVQRGASIVRVHDVKETVGVLKVLQAAVTAQTVQAASQTIQP
ncbi:MAG: dihydropteroate synthase [Pseudomonadota bacterium]